METIQRSLNIDQGVSSLYSNTPLSMKMLLLNKPEDIQEYKGSGAVASNKNMANLDHLYPEGQRQQAFVDHQSGILVALAGPGTGKTYSFLLRISELTEKRNINSTNNA